MILQTLYQQCIKNEVAFFDEFHVVDVVLDGRTCLRCRRRRPGLGRGPPFPGQGGPLGDGRVRPDVPGHVQCLRQHRRRSGGPGPARRARSRTWNSSSSTRRAFAASAFSSPRPSAARAASCGTGPASDSWSDTRPGFSTSPPATSSRGPSSRRSGRAGASRRRVRRRLCRPRRHRAREGDARGQAPRHHRVLPDLPRHRPGGDADPRPADGPLRHGRHPDGRSRPGLVLDLRASPIRAFTPRGNAPASPSTAPTGSARTASWTWSCSAGGPAITWPSSRPARKGRGAGADGLELARSGRARLEPRPGRPGPTAHDLRRRMEALMTDKVGHLPHRHGPGRGRRGPEGAPP